VPTLLMVFIWTIHLIAAQPLADVASLNHTASARPAVVT